MPNWARTDWVATGDKPTKVDLDDIGHSIRQLGYGQTSGTVPWDANGNDIQNLRRINDTLWFNNSLARVGIGPASGTPLERIHAYGSANNLIRLDDTPSGAIYKAGAYSAQGVQGTFSNHPLLTLVNAVVREEIPANGESIRMQFGINSHESRAYIALANGATLTLTAALGPCAVGYLTLVGGNPQNIYVRVYLRGGIEVGMIEDVFGAASLTDIPGKIYIYKGAGADYYIKNNIGASIIFAAHFFGF